MNLESLFRFLASAVCLALGAYVRSLLCSAGMLADDVSGRGILAICPVS